MPAEEGVHAKVEETREEACDAGNVAPSGRLLAVSVIGCEVSGSVELTMKWTDEPAPTERVPGTDRFGATVRSWQLLTAGALL